MPPTVKEYLERQIKPLADEALALTQKAEQEGRELTDEERAKINENMNQVGDLKSRIKGMQDHEDLMQTIKDIAVVGNTEPAPEEAKTMGEAFARSEGYKALKSRGFGGKWTTGVVDFPAKLTDGGLSVVSTGDAGGSLPLQPQVARGPVGPVENPLVVAALFGSGTATQNTIVYLEETTTTPGALDQRYSDSDATVTLTAEGAAKPAAFVNFTKRSVSLDKIAAFLPVSDEMLEDEPQIVSYINTRLALFIRQAEDAYLLDELLAAGIGTATAAEIGGSAGNRFDAIAAGIAAVQVEGGLNPDAILMNPVDFWKMSISKTGVSGDYFGDPFAGPRRTPWGIPVVLTPGINAGTAIVGAFAEGGQVWRKGGVSVEASNSHEDYFRKNLTAIRAEERLALAVYRPAAFQAVSL